MVRRQNFASSGSGGSAPAPPSSDGRPKCSTGTCKIPEATWLTNWSAVSDRALTAFAHGIWTGIKTYRYLKKGGSGGKAQGLLPELHYQQVRGVIEKAEMDKFSPFLEGFARAIAQLIQIHSRDTDGRHQNLVRLYQLVNDMDRECQDPLRKMYATTWQQIRQLANRIEARCGRRCRCAAITSHLTALNELSSLSQQALVRLHRSPSQAHASTIRQDTAASHPSAHSRKEQHVDANTIRLLHSAIELATAAATRATLPARTRENSITYMDGISSLARQLQRIHSRPPAEKDSALKSFDGLRAAAASRCSLTAGHYRVAWTALADLGRQVHSCPSNCRCHLNEVLARLAEVAEIGLQQARSGRRAEDTRTPSPAPSSTSRGPVNGTGVPDRKPLPSTASLSRTGSPGRGLIPQSTGTSVPILTP